jgi:tRNA uridine 5-carboxymethylaminomethyl modification enzyme
MFDIVIIGGGHAGVEAAYMASQFNLKIAIITLPNVGIASAPCNPSIGGVGKGQVVREIDCLGGIMGKLADLAGIQFRTLNESKGYAVQSTRVQIDKVRYSINAEEQLSKIKNIFIIKEEVLGISGSDDMYSVRTTCSTWNTKKIIITIGTFLSGKMHTGLEQTIGGREGVSHTDTLSDFFRDIKMVAGRFKTGTPARINKQSIEYSLLEEQRSDSHVESFHVLHGTNERFLEQKSCYLTYTNSETMRIIRDNKERSPLFNGQIDGVGARYCPSIEDKAYRYPDKDIHHVFIEPESHELNTVYPSGISTSLPRDIQDQVLSSIAGLKKSKIEVYGYAVEYDVIDTTRLGRTLEHKDKKGLYFAGQVNGTSGYEEAAGQGLVAGINAALSNIGKKEFILDRDESYIGVMIEDLVSNIRDEPYRLFTARCENRLYIREDNALLRMYPYRKSLGLAMNIDNYGANYVKAFKLYLNIITSTYLSTGHKFLLDNKINVLRRTSLAEILKQSSLEPIITLEKYFNYVGIDCDLRLVRTLAVTMKYDGYIAKANSHLEKLNKLNKHKINWEDLMASENISFECKQRIERIKPETFGQIKLMEGIRPASLAAIAGTLQ